MTLSGTDLIIDHTLDRPVWKRIVETALTTSLWMFLAYLLMPFAVMLVLNIKYQERFNHTFNLIPTRDLMAFVAFCGAVCGGIILGVLGWGWGNYLAFLRWGKSPPRAIASDEELAAYAGLEVEVLRQWRETQTMVVSHDQSGWICTVVCLPNGPEDRETVL